MKRFISGLIIISLLVTGCSGVVVDNPEESVTEATTVVVVSSEGVQAVPETETEDLIMEQSEVVVNNPQLQDLSYSLSDPELLDCIEGGVYYELIDDIGDEYYIENVSTVYLSQEYIDELTYNSQSNVFFGYTLEELNEQFQGTRYVFTVDENGETVVEPLEAYDDTYYQMIKNVAVGAGVILLCVTVSAITAGAGAPAASMIFAMSAQGGAIGGITSAAIGGVAAGLTTGLQTGDWDQAMTDGALAASEGFMMGAICGSLVGGATEAIGLHGAALNGLTMDEAAIIQRESKLPLSLIGEFESMDQYYIIRDAGLYGEQVNGAQAIIRDIDLNYLDEYGRTNLERMQAGLAPLDPDGVAYELHHMGQSQDSVLAILTQEEHRGAGNHAIWHDLISASEVDHGTAWTKQRMAFWQGLAAVIG